MHEIVAMIGRTIFVRRITTKLCPSFLQSPSCVLFTIFFYKHELEHIYFQIYVKIGSL